MKANGRLILLLVPLLTLSTAAAEGGKWYTAKNFEEAKKQATILGRPLAILVHDKGSSCGLHNGQRAEWKRLRSLNSFVCVLLEQSEEKQFVGQLRKASAGAEGKYIPWLFLTTVEGKYLGVVPYDTSGKATRKIIADARKKFGPIPSPATAKAVWKRLLIARKLWEQEKYDKALPLFRQVAALKKKNPNLPILTELKKDEKAINERGSEALEGARALVDGGKLEEAKAAVKKIHAAYKGFEVAGKAVELAGEIKKAEAGAAETE